jgi:Cdc6-like AAA superfamily ATPase
VTRECLDANIETTDKEAVTEKLLSLPFNHFLVLTGVTGWTEQPSGDIEQPVTSAEVVEILQSPRLATDFNLTEWTVRELVTDLKTMGLLDTWTESRDREGRSKRIETAFESQWVRDAIKRYIAETDQVDREELLADTEASK